jgi:hypothetical protein
MFPFIYTTNYPNYAGAFTSKAKKCRRIGSFRIAGIVLEF